MKMKDSSKMKIQKYSQTIFVVLAWFLLLCIIIQVSLAGLAIFVDDAIWGTHNTFVLYFELIPVLMYIFGSAGNIPQKFKAWSFILFLLCNFEYYTTRGWLGAIHTVFALVIFMIALYVAWNSYQSVFKQKKEAVKVS